MGTLAVWSGAIFWVGVVLQVALLLLILRRRLATQAWIFAGLLVFYAVRSLLMYGLVHRLSHEAYTEVYTSLSLIDLILQAALAGELLVVMVKSVRRRVTIGVTVLVIAMSLAIGLTALLPTRSPIPADRAVIFCGGVFVALFCIAARGRLNGWPRSLMMGLALVGVSQVAAECGKSVAAFHHDAQAFLAWSYGNAAVYILILIYWIFAAFQHGHEEDPMRRATVLEARGTI